MSDAGEHVWCQMLVNMFDVRCWWTCLMSDGGQAGMEIDHIYVWHQMTLNLKCGPIAGEHIWWSYLCLTPDDIEFEMWTDSWWTCLMSLVRCWWTCLMSDAGEYISCQMGSKKWCVAGEHVWCQIGMKIDNIYVWHQVTLNLKCGLVAGEHTCLMSDGGEHVWYLMGYKKNKKNDV